MQALEPKHDFVTIRSFLWNNVDKILESLSAGKNFQKIDADDLFASTSDESSATPTSNFRQKYELKPELQILQEEKEGLGIYVSGNPLTNYQELLDYCRQIGFLDNLYLVVVEKIKKIFTKKGAMMLALELTSGEFKAEGIVFNKNALGIAAKLEEKQLYWVWGKLSQKEKKETDDDDDSIKEYDEMDKLIVESVSPLDQGIKSILEEMKLQISENRLKMLLSLDFQALAKEPKLLTKSLNKIEQKENEKKEVSVQTSATKNIEVFLLKIPKTTPKEKVLEIKHLLQTEKKTDHIEVALELETASGYRKAKNSFWVDTKTLATIKGLLGY